MHRCSLSGLTPWVLPAARPAAKLQATPAPYVVHCLPSRSSRRGSSVRRTHSLVIPHVCHRAGGPHPGFASLPPALHAMMGNPPARSSQQRGTSAGGSSSSRAAGSAAAAAAAVAGALPLPLPVALPGTSPGSTSGDAAMHAALPEQQQQQQIVAAGLASSPPTAAGVEEVGAAAGTSMEQVGGIACSPTLPPPIMVFHSPRQAAGLAASLQRLQLSGGARDEVPEAPGQDDPAEPAGSAAAEGSNAGRSGSGSLGGLAHQQPRAELAIA